MIGKKRGQGIQWLWIVIVLLFPVAATLTPPAPGLCVGQNHADCPFASPTPGLNDTGYDGQSAVRQKSCCFDTPHISRPRVCRCSKKGGSLVPGNAAVIPVGSEVKLAPPKAWVGELARTWNRGLQDLFLLPSRLSGPPTSLALGMVQVTVLLI